jgi:hypothetical protein
MRQTTQNNTLLMHYLNLRYSILPRIPACDLETRRKATEAMNEAQALLLSQNKKVN